MINMVQAIINIDDRTNKILNAIKAKYGLKDESAAIDFIVAEYEEEMLEPELKLEYIEKLKKIEKQKTIDVGTVENLRKRYGI
jgi:soluble P-type ATPase